MNNPSSFSNSSQGYYNQLNYVRTTPLNMVCRDPDREVLVDQNEFQINNMSKYNQSSEDQVRLPLAENQNIVQNGSSLSQVDSSATKIGTSKLTFV